MVPLAAWFRGDMAADYAREVLVSTDAAQRGLLDTRAVETMLIRHQNGAANLDSVIWTLLMFQLWCHQALPSR